jgi:serine/threonine protein kinase
MSLEKLVGQTLDGKYHIERELGRGGMGTVYLAIHLGTERAVAVKVISPQFMRRTEFVERFRREARAAGRLRHPNVVDVTDFGFAETEIGAVAYLVMEYLDGCTLGEILDEEKQLPLAWSIDIIEQVCSAVHEAHGQGIIHRDLKPDNIWLEPNLRGGYTVKVLDFGIAKLEESFDEHENHSLALAAESSAPSNLTASLQKRRTAHAFNQNSQSLSEADKFAQTISTENSENETLANDFENNPTFIGDQRTLTKTIGSENSTILQDAIAAENDSLVALTENLTLISDEDAENGTQILPASENQTQINPSLSDDNGATRILTEQPEISRTNKLIESSKVSASGKKTSAKFALSNADSSGSSITRVGAVLGTPLYMSPEQCRGQKLNSRADIYSLGIIAYQMLAGNTPFSGTYTEVMKAHCDDPPPLLKARKIPRLVRETIFSAMEKDPEMRPPTALTFASQLRAHSEGVVALLRKAFVMWGEHLPTFWWVTFLLTLPLTMMTFLHVIIQILILTETIPSMVGELLTVLLALVTIFVGIFCGSMITGIMTWIVVQLLAVPLRPVTWRPAFLTARKSWRLWMATVIFSSIISFFGFVFGFPLGIALYIRWIIRDIRPFFSMISQPNLPHNRERWRKFSEQLGIRGIIKAFLTVFIVFSGFFWSIRYALVPSILMMESLGGKKSLKRSAELVKRSYWIAAATVLIHVALPVILAGVTAGVANSLVNDNKVKTNSTKVGVEKSGIGGISVDFGDDEKKNADSTQVATHQSKPTQIRKKVCLAMNSNQS